MTTNIKRRNPECNKFRRALRRSKMSESFYGSSYHYVKCFLIWALVVGLDYLVDFRFEYFWPCWLLIRSVCDSYKYQGALFSAFFTCIAVASDVICYLFVPPVWIFFLGSTYVWVQFLWQTERGLCFPTVVMWIIFIYVEFAFRLRDAKSIPFSIDLCRPFAAHCIGYPVVSLGFGVKSYISYKFRLRRQKEVQNENQFYMQLLEQALPEECRAATCNKESDNYSKALPEESSESCSTNAKKRNVTSNGKLPASTQSEDAEYCETRQLTNHTNGSGLTNNVNSRRDSTPSSAASSVAQKSVTISDQVISASISDDPIGPDSSSHHSVNCNGSVGSAGSSNSNSSKSQHFKNGLHSNSLSGGGNGRRVHNNTSGVPGKDSNLHGPTSNSGGKGSSAVGGKGNRSQANGQSVQQNPPLNNCVVLKKDDTNSRIARLENEAKRLRADLQSSRSTEQDLRNQLALLASQERSVKVELNQYKQDNESLQNRLHNLVQKNQQDKSSLLSLEKRLNDEKRQRQTTENALASEKKCRREDQEAAAQRAALSVRNGQQASSSAASSDGFCGQESCRTKRHDLEAVVKGLRRDLSKREEQIRSQDRAMEQMRQYREAMDSKETLMTALNAMKEKNEHLDRALKDENRLKQELLSALHNGKRDIDVLQAIIADKDRQITDLRMKMAEFAAVVRVPSGSAMFDANAPPSVFHPPPMSGPPNCRSSVPSPGPAVTCGVGVPHTAANQQQAPGSPPVVSQPQLANTDH